MGGILYRHPRGGVKLMSSAATSPEHVAKPVTLTEHEGFHRLCPVNVLSVTPQQAGAMNDLGKILCFINNLNGSGGRI